MAKIIAIRKKRSVRIARPAGRPVTIAVRGVDIQVRTSRKRQ
jgi:hypothetical protein